MRAAIIALLMVTVFFYSDGITSSFSADDYDHLVKNIHFEGIGEALTVFAEFDGREYRPVVRLSLWLNYQMGQSAIPFHVTNMLLHLTCVALLYLLILKIWNSRNLALLGATLFALHPIHSASIHFIMGRTDLLAATFYLACLIGTWLWFRENKLIYAVLTWVTFFLALLSKETSITLPVMMLATLTIRPDVDLKQGTLQALSRLWPFCLIAGGYLTIRLIHWADMPESVSVYTDYSLANILHNYVQWIFGLLYPGALYPARHWFEISPLTFYVVSLMVTGVLMAVVALLLWPRRRTVLQGSALWLGVTWFIITLLPIMGGSAHRWYLYLPSVCLSFLAIGVFRLTSGWRRVLFMTMFSGFLVFAMATLMRQSAIWASQSAITQEFLELIEEHEIHRLQRLHFANVPFGYKSAFLFSSSTLESAIELKHGRAPEIQILSYVNLSDDTVIQSNTGPDYINFNMTPDHYAYFLFPPDHRRFPGPKFMSINGHEIHITQVTLSGLADRYSIKWPDQQQEPLYFYDGRAIHRIH